VRLGDGPLPIQEAVSVLRDVARALAYAHEQRLRAESACEVGPLGSYDDAMAALGLGDRAGAVAGLKRSMERHELFGIEASPGCNPVFDPLHELRSFQELMRRYGIKMCEAG